MYYCERKLKVKLVGGGRGREGEGGGRRGREGEGGSVREAKRKVVIL